MTNYTPGQVEDAIVTALTPLKTSLGVATVKVYPLPPKLDEAMIREIKPLMPCLLVSHLGDDYLGDDASKPCDMTTQVLVADCGTNNSSEATRGGTGNPGTYAMLAAANLALQNKVLPTLADGGFTTVRSTAKLYDNDRISVYHLHCQTRQWGHY